MLTPEWGTVGSIRKVYTFEGQADLVSSLKGYYMGYRVYSPTYRCWNAADTL